MKHAICLLAALLVGTPGWAVDGGFLTTYASGHYTVLEYLLCDGVHNAPTDCAEFDLATSPSAGLPKYFVVSLRQDDCQLTANDVQIQLNSRTGITGPAATSPGAHSAGVLSWDGGSSGVASIPVNPTTHRFVRGEVLVGGTGVCADFEVVLRLFYDRFLGQ